MRRVFLVLTCCLVSGCATAYSPIPVVKPALAQEAFYNGKTITIVVGSAPGGFYDQWARLLARYMPKYTPGNPEMIVLNMPGTGGVLAANYVSGAARPDGRPTAVKPDGLTLGMNFPYIYFEQLRQKKQAQFDYASFSWIGSTDRFNNLLVIRADSPFKTIHDVRRSAEPPKCKIISVDYPMMKLLEETIGAKFGVMTGFQLSEMDQAVERGEVQCRVITIAQFFSHREPYLSWRGKGFVRLLFQTGLKRDPRAADVPTLYELMDEYKTLESSRRLAKLILAGGHVGRPIIGTPGIPADRVKILRGAFMKALADPDLLAEAQKKNLEIDPTSGEELEVLAKEVTSQPPEIVERAIMLVGR